MAGGALAAAALLLALPVELPERVTRECDPKACERILADHFRSVG